MTAHTPRPVMGRRAFLLSGIAGLAGVTLTGCAVRGGDAVELSTPWSPPPPTLPPVAPYSVLPGEVEPAVKEAAVSFAEAVFTATTAGEAATGVEQRLSESGHRPELAAPLLPLLPAEGPSALEVVYPQYAGLTPARDQAGIMLVAQHLFIGTGADGADGVESRSITLDVRLARTGESWAVTEVIPASPPPAVPTVSDAARAVLGQERIRLPGAARADILGGTIDDRVLLTLTALAERWTVDVLVLASGHPRNVFAKDVMSNHAKGRAVDIWAFDGIPVIDQARAPWKDAMNAAAAAGSTEVGGPIDPGVRPFFADAVHQDHLHIGFDGP